LTHQTLGGTVSRLERNWQYAEQYPTETDPQVHARRLSLELGIEPVSRAIAAQLSGLVAMSDARAICEIGTGVGVSGLALLRYAEAATLTSIEIEAEHLRQAKKVFAEAGVANARLRFIEGDAGQVLPRLNTEAYDVVLIDADAAHLLDHFESALQIVRVGGTIAIPNAFGQGRVTEPAARDTRTQNLRDLLATVGESEGIAPVLSPAGDGLLMITRLPAS